MKRSFHIIIVSIAILIVAAVVVFLFVHNAKQAKADELQHQNAVSVQELKSAQASATQQVPILVYHSIAPKPNHPESQMQLRYRIDPANFAAQMQFLKANGYTPITFNALANYYSNGTPIPQKSVVLTFDDGWYSQYQYAVPILEADGFTASFYIITDYMHGPYMTWDDIRDLDAHGFEIGSHTEHHVDLANVTDPNVLHQEIFGSKQMIESELGHSITTFVYPDYGTNSDVESQIQTAGYNAARGGWANVKNSAGVIYDLKSQEAVNNPDPFSRVILPSN